MPDYGTMYRESQGRILSLATNQASDMPVPACPGWTVHDVVAHLSGSFRDVLAGKVDDLGDDEWTAAQVDARRERSVSEIASEWHTASHMNAMVFQTYGQILMADVITHEFDIRGALGNTEFRTSQPMRSATLFYLNALNYVFGEDGVPPLRILTEDKALDVGGSDSQASVEMSWWEAGRVVTGRRSIEQVRSLTWSDDPSPWLPHLFVFGPRDADLKE